MVQWRELCASIMGAGVHSLVGELTSHKLCGVAKNKIIAHSECSYTALKKAGIKKKKKAGIFSSPCINQESKITYRISFLAILWWFTGYDSALSQSRAWVCSLLGELRSYPPCSLAPQNKFLKILQKVEDTKKQI